MRIPEQQRIVAILDTAFAGLATATANAEKNLKNARELSAIAFEALFKQNAANWPTTTIGDQVLLQRGYDITKRQQNFGHVPVVSSGGIKSFHDTAMTHAPGVVLGRKGSLGTVFYLDQDYWPHDTTLWVKDFKGNDPKFVYYFFKSLDLAALDTGAANPALNRNVVHPITVRWPSVDQQIEIVERIESIGREAERLQSLYQQKLAKTVDLKQSILQKAFSGELTSLRAAADVATSLSKASLISIDGISPTDLHAGIIAIAYQKHQGHPKQNTFGHVKAEKISHMVEARIGIELERNPIKDAAGPNDYRHLKKVESRAEKAGFFSVKQSVGGGYTFIRKNRFDELVDKTRKCLGDYNDAVDAIIEEFLPMDTQQAEIFATVYAAWNNLLIEGAQITDEAIIHEARDNWHPDKLKIASDRFLAAINWIKVKGIVPKGDGKKVVAKG